MEYHAVVAVRLGRVAVVLRFLFIYFVKCIDVYVCAMLLTM